MKIICIGKKVLPIRHNSNLSCFTNSYPKLKKKKNLHKKSDFLKIIILRKHKRKSVLNSPHKGKEKIKYIFILL